MSKASQRIGVLAAAAVSVMAYADPASASAILFVGNSFTYGEPAGAPPPTVEAYQPSSVTDLNGTGVGGVPALFKEFTVERGLSYTVSLETVGGTGVDYHYNNKLGLIDKPWDAVVLQGYSTLDAAHPGNPATLIKYTGLLAQALHDQNSQVGIYLDSTWSRADLTYKTPSPWLGQPIDAMEKSVQAGYEQAAAASPYVRGVVPVGAAWNDAIQTGFADANPFDGITPGQIDLWAPEGYHASPYGYYLEALTEFGVVTGVDPRTLGPGELAAAAFNISPDQAMTLQAIAYAEIAPAPEPASAAALLVGLVGLLWARHRTAGNRAAGAGVAAV